MEDQVGVTTGSNVGAVGATQTGTIDLSKKTRIGESIIQGLLFFCGAVSIFTTLGIVFVLASESIPFFFDPRVGLVEFFTATTWQPQIEQFGIAPLVISTLRVAVIALIVAVPLGIGSAIYLSEYADRRVRNVLKPTLEVLAGVPTVVYGYFAISFVTPLLRGWLNTPGSEVIQIYNTLSAGLVVGVLITPLIASMSEDSLSAVPSSLRQASYGLGATRFETAIRVVTPAALSGILAAVIIATSRAVGETMVVAIAAGAGPNFTFNPLLAAETMTGHIARISGGDLSYQSIDYQSIFAIGLVLFMMTLALNIVSRIVVARFREVYD
ncbi:MAG: phosphate ABC transporter permease subunit PstC [Chloroflexaceae bacterium]|nr:phosphate ABC transporter permease subunit PstC [Chloroflexaceae bacterium]